MTCALLRFRAETPSRISAARGSSTMSSAPALRISCVGRETMATPAPDLSARAAKSWPSRLSPLIATKMSPSASDRLSIETPPNAPGGLPSCLPPVARVTSSAVQSSVMRPLADCGSHHLLVAEGSDLRADGLPGFMPLAGDEQNIALLQRPDGLVNGLLPVADFDAL